MHGHFLLGADRGQGGLTKTPHVHEKRREVGKKMYLKQRVLSRQTFVWRTCVMLGKCLDVVLPCDGCMRLHAVVQNGGVPQTYGQAIRRN